MGDKNSKKGKGPNNTQQMLNEILEHLQQSVSHQKKLSWWSRGATLAIVIVFALYIMLFYQMLSKNLSAERFAKNIQSSMSQITPGITDSFIEVLSQLTPVYMDLASKKVDVMLPDFINSTETQAEVFALNMSKFAENHFQQRMEKIAKEIAGDFRKKYPDLTDEQIERFIEETEDDFKTAFIQISENILDQSLPEILDMKYIAETLADKDMPDDTMELSKLFLHKLLILFDKEIMGEE